MSRRTVAYREVVHAGAHLRITVQHTDDQGRALPNDSRHKHGPFSVPMAFPIQLDQAAAKVLYDNGWDVETNWTSVGADQTRQVWQARVRHHRPALYTNLAVRMALNAVMLILAVAAGAELFANELGLPLTVRWPSTTLVVTLALVAMYLLTTNHRITDDEHVVWRTILGVLAIWFVGTVVIEVAVLAAHNFGVIR